LTLFEDETKYGINIVQIGICILNKRDLQT